MSTLRTKLVRDLRAADKHGRLHCVYPDVPGLCDGECLDVHSKVMIVDDEWCRIGSSNLSNRSMGMDTECDLTIEAQGDAKIAAAIRQFRDDLIAEHSAAPRRLLELPAPELTGEARHGAGGDPGSPLALERIVEQVAPEVKMKKGFKVRKALYILGGVIAAAVVLALLWTRTPLAEWVTRENASQIADWFAERWWAPFLVVLVYTPASFIMFPRWIITMTAVLAFGPWHGLVYAFAGVIIAGICTFLPGRMVSRDTIRRLAGRKLKPLMHFMGAQGPHRGHDPAVDAHRTLPHREPRDGRHAREALAFRGRHDHRHDARHARGDGPLGTAGRRAGGPDARELLAHRRARCS
jgi:hypothetical protein